MSHRDSAKSLRGILALASAMMAAPVAMASFAYPPEGVSFGEIASGEATERSVELQNKSNRTILVSKVKGCCGSEATLSTMSIAPNASSTLTVSLKPQPPGEFSKNVRIYSDDPESPVLTIPVSGLAVFVLASKTTDAFQMAQWSSRNVIPAKIALGVVFAVLAAFMGVLIHAD